MFTLHFSSFNCFIYISYKVYYKNRYTKQNILVYKKK